MTAILHLILLITLTLTRPVLLHEPLVQIVDSRTPSAPASVLILGEDVSTLGDEGLGPASWDELPATPVTSATSESSSAPTSSSS